jgi:hypothetical protein
MPQITFNGKPYELVTLDDVTIDEAIVVWEYAHVSLDQIPDLEGMHPGVVKALIHIAVARGEPGESARSIRDEVGRLRMAELQDVFQDISEEVEDLPPPSAAEPTSTSEGSGGTSEPTTGPHPAPSAGNGSGSPGSATGATSDQRISVG